MEITGNALESMVAFLNLDAALEVFSNESFQKHLHHSAKHYHAFYCWR
jgi:hypothetical protein